MSIVWTIKYKIVTNINIFVGDVKVLLENIIFLESTDQPKPTNHNEFFGIQIDINDNEYISAYKRSMIKDIEMLAWSLPSSINMNC